MPASRGGLSSFLYADEEDDDFKLTAEQEDFTAYIFESVWNFCTATWPLVGTKTREAVPILWTRDVMRNEKRPFPHYPYLRDCILDPIFMAPRLDERGRPRKLRFIIPKPRQMFVTNGILAGCLWHVLKHEASEWLVAKNKKPEAEKFVKERVRFMYSHLPAWIAGRSGPESRAGFRTVNPKPAGRFWVDQTESGITAVARTFGESGEAIGETANGVLDEAIRIQNLEAVWSALDAQAPIIIAISAPPERGQRIDPRSMAFFRELAEGLEPGSLVKTIVGRSDLVAPDEDDYGVSEDMSALAEVV